MAPKRRTRKKEDTPPPAAKRQKRALGDPKSRSQQLSGSRRNRATKEAFSKALAAAKTIFFNSPTATDVVSPLLVTYRAHSKRPRRKPRHRPPRNTESKTPHVAPKPRDLLSLPLELQQHIFLYTSAKETARLRQVCKALDVVVRSSTKRLAKQFSRKEMKRIQQQVNEFASLKAPTDFDSLMEALHIWTERRGSFEKHEVQQDSAAKLMMHFFLGLDKKYEEEDGNKILQWAATTAYITKLCHDSDSG